MGRVREAAQDKILGRFCFMAQWLQKARKRMERKGTVGAFGKATPGKIARGKKHGGLEKKRAVFAENMRKIARKRRHGRSGSRS